MGLEASRAAPGNRTLSENPTYGPGPVRPGAVGDSSFVFRLEAGRTARAATAARVRAYLAAHAEARP